MIAYFLLALLLLVVGVLVFWQYSNVKSALLGAPAISSPHHHLLKWVARSDQTWLDLGCGNGSVCVRLAPLVKQVYGIEYSPFYYLVARWRTRKLKNVTIIYGDMMRMDWPPVDIIHCYLLRPLLEKMKDKLAASGAVVVCLAFPVTGWQADEILSDNSRQKLFVYKSPQSGLEKSE